MNPAPAILACAALAMCCAVLALTAVQQFEPQWVTGVSASENGHALHCKYVGSHSWECK